LTSAVLGVAFWVLAARRYDASDVGIDVALIGAMGFVSNLAHLNLTNAFNRFVPTTGSHGWRLVARGYAVAVVLSIVAAGLFIAGAQLWTPKLAGILQSPLFAAGFIGATVLWTVFTLQDSVLTGLGRARLVLVENTSYGALKALLLVAFVVIVPHRGVYAAWSLALIAFVIPVSVVLVRALRERTQPPAEVLTGGDVARYVLPDYFASLLWMATTSLLPLLVLAIMGPDASAFAFIAWTLAYTLFLVSRMMGMSLITEGARNPGRIVAYTRETLVRTLQIVVPLSFVLALGARWWLIIFKGDYAEHATRLLQLLALSAIPYVVVSTYLSVARIQRHMVDVFVVTGAMSVAIITLSAVFLPIIGLSAVGWAWLVTETITAGILLCGRLRTVWLGHLPVNRLRKAPRDYGVPPEIAGRRSLEPALQIVHSDPALADCTIDRCLGDNGNITTYAASFARGQAVLKLSRTSPGDASLTRAVTALEAISSLHAFDAASSPVPRVVAARFAAGRHAWCAESSIRGVDARSLLSSTERYELIAAVADALRPMYAASARVGWMSDPMMEPIAFEPLQLMVETATPRIRESGDPQRYAALKRELQQALTEAPLTTSLVHGDLWLGNVLWDSAVAGVGGIIDWDASHRGIPALEIVSLLCTTRAIVEQVELGAVVREILTTERWLPVETELLSSVPGADELSARVLVLLWWCQHVAANLRKSESYERNSVWLAHNVHRVLDVI
jgi:O-antigen/teichoic acid export membrane protein